MQITTKQLRRIIREEYIRATPPTRPGQLMTEQRANLLAEQMLEEGLFDIIKAGVAGLKAGTGAVAGAAAKGAKGAVSKIGDTASKALAPAAAAVQKMAAAASETAKSVTTAIGAIKDDAVKKAAEAAQETLKQSLKDSLKKSLATAVQNLVSAGIDENEAKTLASEFASAAMADVFGGGG